MRAAAPTPYQVPTRQLLGDEGSDYSDTSSQRTCTTLHDFFEEDRRWGATGSSTGSSRRLPTVYGYDEGTPSMRRPPRPGRLGTGEGHGGGGGASPAACASVLPCMPPGKVPGGRPVTGLMSPSARSDLLFAPRAFSRAVGAPFG